LRSLYAVSEGRTQRRLAAILATDVIGYSRQMEVDEIGTLAAPKVRRKDVIEPLLARHQGLVFKVTRDGVLVEFTSAVNAMRCAVDLQQGMAAANDGQPKERHIVLRDTNVKYGHFAALPPLLFDYTRGSDELVDISESPQHQRMRSDYAHRLLSWRMQHTDKTLSHIRVRRERMEVRE
jgi:hypothetical protein